jgi:hypothetical protein
MSAARAPDDYARLGVPVPRDGGLRELLEWVERGALDRVVCERISRVTRDVLPCLQVEYHLASRGVMLECANEPRGGMTTGQLELRRTSQVRAEIYGTNCWSSPCAANASTPPPDTGTARPVTATSPSSTRMLLQPPTGSAAATLLTPAVRRESQRRCPGSVTLGGTPRRLLESETGAGHR